MAFGFDTEIGPATIHGAVQNMMNFMGREFGFEAPICDGVEELAKFMAAKIAKLEDEVATYEEMMAGDDW